MKKKLFSLLLGLSLLFVASPLDSQQIAVMNSGINLQTGANYAITCADSLKLVQLSNAAAQTPTMPNATTCGAGVVWQIVNIGAGAQTITPSTSTISYYNGLTYVSGAASIVLTTGKAVSVFTDGTNYFAFFKSGARVLSCDIAVGDASGSALANAQLGPQKRLCYIPVAATVVEMDVAADGGTPNVIAGVNHAGTTSNIVSAALATAASGGIACSRLTAVTCIDGATTGSATLQNTSIVAGDYIELVSGTAGGTAKLMTIHVLYTVN